MTTTPNLPSWMRSQITAAQADNTDTTTALTVYVWTPDGLVAAAGAHDRRPADTYLAGLHRTGLVAPSK